MPLMFIGLVAGVVLFFCLPFTDDYIGDGALLLMMVVALGGIIASAVAADHWLGTGVTEVFIAFGVLYALLLVALAAAIFFDIKESSSSEGSR